MMKIFKYLYYMMLGVLVGCILMTIAGCKEEQKRDPSFVAKTESVNKDLEIVGSWYETYYDGYGNYYITLDFDSDGLCEGSGIVDGVRVLLFTAEYKYSSNQHSLDIYNAILSPFASEIYSTNGGNSATHVGGIEYAEIRSNYLRLVYIDGSAHNFKRGRIA